MSVPIYCKYCGYHGISRAFRFVNSTNVTLRGNRETCPNCGQLAEIQDGTYDFVGEVMTAVRAPGVMRDDVLAFQTLAKAVQAGELSQSEASSRIEILGKSFAALWALVNVNSGTLALIVAIVALYLQITSNLPADAGSDQAHSDAQRQYDISQQIRDQLGAIEGQSNIAGSSRVDQQLENPESRHVPPRDQKLSRQQRRHLERQAKKRSR